MVTNRAAHGPKMCPMTSEDYTKNLEVILRLGSIEVIEICQNGWQVYKTWERSHLAFYSNLEGMGYFLSPHEAWFVMKKIYSNLYPIHSSSRNICDSFLMSKLVDSWERTTITASQPFSEKWLLCSSVFSCNIALRDKIWNYVQIEKLLIFTQNILTRENHWFRVYFHFSYLLVCK